MDALLELNKKSKSKKTSKAKSTTNKGKSYTDTISDTNLEYNSDSDSDYEQLVVDDEDDGVLCGVCDDDMEEFVKRSEYFQSESTDSGIFDNMSLEEKKEREVLLAKKGKGHYRSMIDDEKLSRHCM